MKLFFLVILFFYFVYSVHDLNDWRLSTKPHPLQEKKIRIALKQRNLKIIKEKFWDISNPKSPNYGKYLSQDEITDLVAPKNHHISFVMSWLKNSGAKELSIVKNRDVITAIFTVQDLEKAFNIILYTYQHPTGKMIIRTQNKLSIPDEISPLIDLTHGLVDFPPVMQRSKSKVVSSPPQDPNTTYEPGVPLILRVTSRDAQFMTFKWIPVCLDGKMATNYNCNSTIQYINVSAHYLDYTYKNEVHQPQEGDCNEDGDSNFVCTFIWKKLTVYEYLTNITLSVSFNNKVYQTQYPFPVVPIPAVTPQTLWRLYGIPNDYFVTDPKFSQCVVEFEQQYYSPEDLKLFFREMGIRGQETPITVIGPNNSSNPGGEANLDIQWIMAMAPGIPTYFWSNPANSTIEIDDILTWAYAIGNMVNPPIVNSISYGMVAENVDKYLGNGYLARSNVEFQKLALRGITIIIADGDSGAGDIGDPPMNIPNCDKLHPDWPSQSPYVTAVGSTYITPLFLPICYLPSEQGGIDCSYPTSRVHGEVGVSLDNGINWSTGGGFADTQKRPSYQDDVVSAFLNKSNLPPPDKFNSTGRAYPDFSACGHNLLTALGGVFVPIDGTSASAPIFAGIVSLLNEIRGSNSKSPLGFLNPLFYQIARSDPTAFNDVVLGMNRCSVYSTNPNTPSCCPFGYSAEIGWDAMTGLGTPNFNILRDLVLKF